MGDIDVDKWFAKMQDHHNRGDHKIIYDVEPYYDGDEAVDRANSKEIVLSLKEQRVHFWEKHRRVVDVNDIIWGIEEMERIKEAEI